MSRANVKEMMNRPQMQLHGVARSELKSMASEYVGKAKTVQKAKAIRGRVR